MSYHDILRDSVADQLTDPETAAFAATCLKQLKSGFWDQSYVDMIFQHFSSRPDIYDAYYFGTIHGLLCLGRVLIAQIEVGSTPSADSEKAKNAAALWEVSLPYLYVDKDNKTLDKLPLGTMRAKFSPSHGYSGSDGDGYFEWLRPLHFSFSIADGESYRKRIRKGSVPLEVGYTRVTTTWIHLMQHGGVARWPYGSDKLFVLINVKPPKGML
jgi:hypothetical protein